MEVMGVIVGLHPDLATKVITIKALERTIKRITKTSLVITGNIAILVQHYQSTKKKMKRNRPERCGMHLKKKNNKNQPPI